MPIEIEVCERRMGGRLEPDIRDGAAQGMIEVPRYHAQIKGKPGVWAAGDSINGAVGDLVQSHPEQFGVAVTLLKGKQAR